MSSVAVMESDETDVFIVATSDRDIFYKILNVLSPSVFFCLDSFVCLRKS